MDVYADECSMGYIPSSTEIFALGCQSGYIGYHPALSAES